MTDTATVQIVRSHIASVMEEMDHRFYRSGYSTIVRESRDFSCVVADREGRLAVAPPMFFHGPVYRHLIRRVLEVHGAPEDGDVFVCNHPGEGNLPHVPDMAVVAPVIGQGRLVAFAASIAHKADMGGAVPGSSWGQATDLFQEGLLLPPTRIARASGVAGDLERVIASNSRAPELVLGDMRAQIGVVAQGRERVRALCGRLGADAFVEALDAATAAAARAFRSALKRLPDGRHEAEGFLDHDGVDRRTPVRLHVAVTVENGRPTFDLSGCAPQTRGPANLRIAMVEACAFYCLTGLLGPALPGGDAVRELVDFVFAPATVVSAGPTAPCSSYMKTCHKLVDVMIEALGPFLPDRAAANAGGSGGSIVMAWHDARPGQGNQYEIFGSAYGAGRGRDGASGVSTHLANLHCTPIEIVEAEFPCRVTRCELVTDSGGAGEFRGGLALRRDYEMLGRATVVYRSDRASVAPDGLAGGGNGATSAFLLDPDTPDERRRPSSFRDEFGPGTRFSLRTPSGGGYGEALRRSLEAVRRDVAEGYVSREGARRDYGRAL